MQPDQSTIKTVRDAAMLELCAARIAVLSGLKPSVIKPEIAGLTEFEIKAITRSFALREFNPVRLETNLEFIFAHFIKNGRAIYDRQMKTAENVFNRLKEKVNNGK